MIEERAEHFHSYFWFRVWLVLFFLVVVAYVNVWLHEFCHFWYAVVVLHDEKAYVVYDPSSWFTSGRCVVSKADTWLYYVGGLGSGLLLLGCWIFLLSIPHGYTTPLEVSVFAFAWNEIVYGLCEGSGLVFECPEVAYGLSSLALFLGYIAYYRRLVKYLTGGDA